MTLTYGTEHGATVLRRDGERLATAFYGRQGWQVSRPTGQSGFHMWFTASEDDARVVLAAIGGAS
jgi:hypothetical protein